MFKIKKKEKIKKQTSINRLIKKRNSNKINKPRTTSQIMRGFFKDFNENNSIIQLDDCHFSVAFEYQDISFAKANYDEQENIFLKWVEYLHSFNYNDHIQVVCAGRPIKTDDYKKDYIYNEDKFDGNEKKIANEFNTLIETTLGNKEEILKETRLIVITTKAESLKEAQDILEGYKIIPIKELGIDIDVEEVHSLQNKGDTQLQILEVQMGSILDENDIERLSDIYGRV